MSTHTPTKTSVKRGLDMSPAKKKPKEVTSICKDDLDAAILSGVSKALKEQQRHFDASVAHAVKEALEGTLIPQLTILQEEIFTANEAIRKVVSDVKHQASEVQKTHATVQSLHATVRSNNHDVNDVLTKLATLQDKLIEMEDRSRRNNLRLVNLPESVGGSNLKAFLVANLPKWIPSLAGQRIEIDRCHRIYGGSTHPRGENQKPRTVIFRLLRDADRQDILQGAHRVKPKHDNAALFFFPDYSPQTSAKRREFTPVIDRLNDRGIRSFLQYPATLKVEHGGAQLYFSSPVEVERFLTSQGTHELGEQPTRSPQAQRQNRNGEQPQRPPPSQRQNRNREQPRSPPSQRQNRNREQSPRSPPSQRQNREGEQLPRSTQAPPENCNASPAENRASPPADATLMEVAND
ncbi:hypothetical protein PBY51_000056 [Eleginops maclovinus]|uniref:LINE-1 type transposase domain-containing 1 n=1 Tax=Eleginops maclovinus TaxID=56733 RepID=A0AAN8AK74_ELEMC|nr:hypothetical protein PBY51_000056 [Eleginops maclovinus]